VARERYEGLRAELDVAARNAGGAATGSGAEKDEGEGGDLMVLLRARERRRKLGAVEKAVGAVERAGEGVVGAKIDDVVKRAVGDVPVLPTQRGYVGGGGGGGREEGEMRVVELKKAILKAKATIESCEREQDSTEEQRASGTSELHTLQQARNELIGWIETQLALIGDAQAEESNDPSSSPTKSNEDEETGPIASPAEIMQLYDRYLEARDNLLDTVQQPHDISPLAPAPASPKQTRTTQDIDMSTKTATALLPFISPLLATQSAEQALIAQAAYVRRQLAAADSSSEKLLRRHAEESHLVHPGASRGRDWARAGEEVGETTREYVIARAKAGEIASKEADSMVGRLEGITGGLERLVATQ